jgi:stage IV sporulation protein B
MQKAIKDVLLRAVVLSAVMAVVLMGVHNAYAAEERRMLVPMGNAVGIKLFSDGVIVVGFAENLSVPAKSSGLRVGDIITHINHSEVDTIEEVRSLVQESGTAPLSIRVSREEKQLEVETVAIQAQDGQYLLGAWIRDSMAGIGTITYYDPAAGSYAALGHPINDIDTGVTMPVEDGGLMPATVIGVRKGEKGQPGELQGSFETGTSLGNLRANNDAGIFGALEADAMTCKPALPVAQRNEVQVGKASIYSTIGGSEVREYEIEILRVFPDGGADNRDLMLKVTDPTLLAATNGIVQGMSGSPIVQNGKFIGAVTHVLVGDPAQGYGILATTMLTAV